MANLAHFAAIADQQPLPLFVPHLFGQAGQVVRAAFLDGLLDLRGGLIARSEELVHSEPGQADRIEDRGVGVANQHRNRRSKPLNCFQKLAGSPAGYGVAQRHRQAGRSRYRFSIRPVRTDRAAEVLTAQDFEGRFRRQPLDAVSY